MKKLLLPFLLLGTAAMAQSTYPGNGKTGFGGVVGPGSLQVSDNGTDITLNFTKGAGGFNDVMVIYFDSQTGGFANTSTLNDQNDGGRRAISGVEGTNRSVVNFPAGFTADFALSWDNNGSALFRLVAGNNESLAFISYTGGNTSRVIPKSALNISGAVSFRFVATYVGSSGYRSNEALVQDIGNGTEPNGNFGWSPVTFANFNSYPSVPLNVTLKQFSARRLPAGVALNWSASCTGAYAHFAIQRSTDGRNFSTIHAEKADAARCNLPFEYIDQSATGGKLFYRLQYTNDVGKVSYSTIATLAGSADATLRLSLYPTIVSGNALLQISNGQKENLHLRVVDAAGRVVHSQRVAAEAGSQSVQLNTSAWRPGVYTIVVANDRSSERTTMKMVKE